MLPRHCPDVPLLSSAPFGKKQKESYFRQRREDGQERLSSGRRRPRPAVSFRANTRSRTRNSESALAAVASWAAAGCVAGCVRQRAGDSERRTRLTHIHVHRLRGPHTWREGERPTYIHIYPWSEPPREAHAQTHILRGSHTCTHRRLMGCVAVCVFVVGAQHRWRTVFSHARTRFLSLSRARMLLSRAYPPSLAPPSLIPSLIQMYSSVGGLPNWRWTAPPTRGRQSATRCR